MQQLDAYHCRKCGTVFVSRHAIESNGTLCCPECKNVVDYVKCCKTCANWSEGGCTHFEVWVEDGDTTCEQSNKVVARLFSFDKGPPWQDCRGWKPK